MLHSKTQQENHQAKNQINLPQLSMPKGGGTAHGVDENFHMDAFTGTASFSIPFPLPPARALTPSLGVSYHSSGGNGLLGCGFDLSEASITIKTNRGVPKYDGTDVYALGGSELVPKKDEVGIYLERHRGDYPLIQFDQQQNYWKVTGNGNSISIYGNTELSRVADPNHPEFTFKWLLSETSDAAGNKVKYTYTKFDQTADANTYLSMIEYGNYFDENTEKFAFKVIIDYGQVDTQQLEQNRVVVQGNTPPQRPDILRSFRSGFKVSTPFLVRNIFVFHLFKELTEKEKLTHGMHFVYDESPIMTQLKSITQTGYTANSKKSLPSIDFEFTKFNPDLQPNYKKLKKGENDLNIPLRFLDAERDGLEGILYRDADTVQYYPFKGDGQYAEAKTVEAIPAGFTDPHQPMTILNLEGNGQLQLESSHLHESGYYEMKSLSEWSEFKPFNKQAVNDLSYKTERVDLSGNNLIDEVIIKPDEILYSPSLGLEGIGILLHINFF